MMTRTFSYCLLVGLLALGFSCGNKIKIREDLGKVFDEKNVEGCFAVLQNRTGELQVYNMPFYKDSALPTGHTSDILLALVGIEEGSLDDAKTTLFADQQLVTLQDAFQNNNSAFFKQLLTQIHQEYLQKFLDTLNYGSSKNNLHGFYVSPDEQLGLVKKMYFNQLPFQERTIRIVRQLFQTENTDDMEWHFKHSEHYDSTLQKTCYWTLGWVIKKEHVSFFVHFAMTKASAYNSPSHFAFTKDLVQNVMGLD